MPVESSSGGFLRGTLLEIHENLYGNVYHGVACGDGAGA